MAVVITYGSSNTHRLPYYINAPYSNQLLYYIDAHPYGSSSQLPYYINAQPYGRPNQLPYYINVL
ncbi:hypothetical protein CBOM_03882 [Ceraceosorus bombacis]|uniref:Uncharacterized protein n=1 Tax=Ceraceosorus bombacis TaxID=401625 RepID=A0A0P1BHU4_9BASI|nr:hypothetical protein CBOM_03882 [Ceraceosorus bombacis]